MENKERKESAAVELDDDALDNVSGGVHEYVEYEAYIDYEGAVGAIEVS